MKPTQHQTASKKCTLAYASHTKPQMKQYTLSEYPLHAYDKIRYADTDRQGHVNNALFSTYLETGRVEMLYHPEYKVIEPGASFVIAQLHIEYLEEILWPGRIEIGTALTHIGNSSLKLHQGLFQNHKCVAIAGSTIVQVKNSQSLPLNEDTKLRLKKLMVTGI